MTGSIPAPRIDGGDDRLQIGLRNTCFSGSIAFPRQRSGTSRYRGSEVEPRATAGSFRRGGIQGFEDAFIRPDVIFRSFCRCGGIGLRKDRCSALRDLWWLY